MTMLVVDPINHSSTQDPTFDFWNSNTPTMAIGGDGMDLLSRVWERAPPSPHNTKDTAILIDSDSDDDDNDTATAAVVVAPPAPTTAANDTADAEGSKKPAASNDSSATTQSVASKTNEPVMSSKSTPSLNLASQTMTPFTGANTGVAVSSFAAAVAAPADSATKAPVADLHSKFESAIASGTATTSSAAVAAAAAAASTSKKSPWDIMDDSESDDDDEDPFDDIIMAGYPGSGDKKFKSSSSSSGPKVVVAPATTTTAIATKVKDEKPRKVSLSPTNAANSSSLHSHTTTTPVLAESIPPAKSYEDEDDGGDNEEEEDDDDDPLDSNYSYAAYLANQQAAKASTSANKAFRCNHCPEQFNTRYEARQHAKTCKQRLELEQLMHKMVPEGGGENATAKTGATTSDDAADHEKEGEGVDEVAEEADEITYTRYSPAKVKFGKEHPGKSSFIVLHGAESIVLHSAESIDRILSIS